MYGKMIVCVCGGGGRGYTLDPGHAGYATVHCAQSEPPPPPRLHPDMTFIQ